MLLAKVIHLIKYTPAFCRLVIVCLLLITAAPVSAQSKWVYEGYFNAGLSLNMNYGKAQKFPGL
jgi:hypothetical protein